LAAWNELGDTFNKRRPASTVKRLVKQLEALGYTVSLEAQAAPVAA
jgi:hypothetical protein